MILQTKASVLTVLMACEGGEDSHLYDIYDAILMARESALTPIDSTCVSNDRTTLNLHTPKK